MLAFAGKKKKSHICPKPRVLFLSLNELLIIIMILCIMSTIFLPLLLRIRSTMKTAMCAANLKNISQATIAYVNDNSQHYPPAEIGELYRWHGTRENIKSQIFDWKRSPLFEFIPKNKEIKICPTMKNLLNSKKQSKRSNYIDGGFGYGYNKNIGSQRCENSIDFWKKPCQELGLTKRQVKEPSKTAMFSDTAALLDPMGKLNVKGVISEYAFCNPYYITNKGKKAWPTQMPSVHFRHNNMANISWCDGHVSKEKFKYSIDDWGESCLGFPGEPSVNIFSP